MTVKSTFGLCGALLLSLGLTHPASAFSQTVKKAFVWNVVESNGIKHGNIVLVYGDGTKEQVTSNGNCSNPQVATDGKTVGWRQGEFLKYGEEKPYWETSIALYRNGRKLKSVGPFVSRSLIGQWHFMQQGKQVALRRFGMHGQSVYMLWDVFGGYASSTWEEYNDGVKQASPAWIAGLEE